MLDTITNGEMIGRYYSIEWVRKNILMQSDEEIDAMDKLMAKEKEDTPTDDDGLSTDVY